MRKIVFGISLILVVATAALLISGSDLLVCSVSESLALPLGTVSTWVGMIALPFAFLSSSERIWYKQEFGKWYAYALWLSALLSTSWGIISYQLSGKWNFTFSGSSPTFVGSDKASEVFWLLSKITAGLPIAIFVVFIVHAWITKRN